jgi:hypothetical protein
VKYVPLPDDAYTALGKRVDSMQAGTVFGGKEQIGMTIDQLVADVEK